jgi:hypothetical protein
MANQKITDLPQAVNSMQATDLMEVSIDNGGGIFTSESFTGQQVSDGVIGVISNYAIIGCAYSAQTQAFSQNTPTAIPTEMLLQSGNCQLSGAGLDTGFEVAQLGLLFVTFEASVWNDGGGTQEEINFYLDLNGAAVTDSARFITAPPNNHVVPLSATWMINVAASDVITVFITVAKANYKLLYEDQFTGHGTPAAKLSIFNIG